MAENDLLMHVLQACAQAAPTPFFPAEFAASSGLPRPDIDAAVDRLRLNGYLQIVDWVQGKGQGYAPTPAGTAALAKPAELRRPAAPPAPEQPSYDDRVWQRGETVRNTLLQPRTPVITRTLVFANLAMFAVGLFVGLMRGVSMEDYLFGGRSIAFAQLLDTLGAIRTIDVVALGEWWRLGSYQFLHSGLLHLGMNMLSLYMLGPALETVWGPRRFLLLYLLSGVIGGAAVVLVGRGAVGASGAISGLITSLGVWVWLNRDSLPQQFAARITSSVGTCLLLLFLMSIQPNVSWEGHLGGALGGALLSLPLHYDRFGVGWQRVLSWIGLIAIPLAAVALAYFVQSRHRDDFARERLVQQYDRQFRGAESYLLQRRNRFIVPALHDLDGNWRNDAKFVVDFQQACQESLTRLQPVLVDLAALTPRHDQEAKEKENVRRYFEAWHEMLQTLERQLAEPLRWNPARRDRLRQLDNALWKLRRPLEANTALPCFSPLVSDPALPAAPKQAGKDVG